MEHMLSAQLLRLISAMQEWGTVLLDHLIFQDKPEIQIYMRLSPHASPTIHVHGPLVCNL